MISPPDFQNTEEDLRLLKIQVIDLEYIVREQAEQMNLLKIRLADNSAWRSEMASFPFEMEGDDFAGMWEATDSAFGAGQLEETLKRIVPLKQKIGDLENEISSLRSEIDYLQQELSGVSDSLSEQRMLLGKMADLSSELELVKSERDIYRSKWESLMAEKKQIGFSSAGSWG